MSAFDPAKFLDTTTTETNERRPPLPTENPAEASGLYTAVIGEISTQDGIVGKGDNIGKPWLSVVIPLKLEIPQQLQAALGIGPVFTLTDRVFVDLTDQGLMDNAKGKNRGQKTYRDATDTNVAGQPFSWRMVQGKVVKVKIKHEMYNGFPVEKVDLVLKG